MNNDYVAIAKKVCPVCNKIHSHDAEILLNRKMKPIKEEETFTGYQLCASDQEKFDKGYVALVTIDPDKSELTSSGNIDMNGAYHLAKVAHIKRNVLPNIINVEVPEKQPFIYIDEEAFDKIQDIFNRIK